MKIVHNWLGIFGGAILVLTFVLLASVSLVTGFEHATSIPFLAATVFVEGGIVFGKLSRDKLRAVLRRAKRGRR